MQSKKVSKKTQTNADESVSASPVTKAASEGTNKSRASRSSKSKGETVEATAAKHRPAAVAAPADSSIAPLASSAPAKTMAAAAGAGHTVVAATTVDPVGVETIIATPAVADRVARTAFAEVPVTHEQIASLAYSYWLSRGGQHGSSVEDWLAAERELKVRS